MGILSDFLNQSSLGETEKFIVSSRFKDENGELLVWEIKSISTFEDEFLRKECTVLKKDSTSGKMKKELDFDKYTGKLAAKCVIFPNLFDQKLQDEYKVFGSDELLKKMLKPGEYFALLKKVSEINGFNSSFSELADEAKN